MNLLNKFFTWLFEKVLCPHVWVRNHWDHSVQVQIQKKLGNELYECMRCNKKVFASQEPISYT